MRNVFIHDRKPPLDFSTKLYHLEVSTSIEVKCRHRGHLGHDGNDASPNLVFQLEILTELLSIGKPVNASDQLSGLFPTLQFFESFNRCHSFKPIKQIQPIKLFFLQPIQLIEPIQPTKRLFFSFRQVLVQHRHNRLRKSRQSLLGLDQIFIRIDRSNQPHHKIASSPQRHREYRVFSCGSWFPLFCEADLTGAANQSSAFQTNRFISALGCLKLISSPIVIPVALK